MTTLAPTTVFNSTTQGNGTINATAPPSARCLFRKDSQEDQIIKITAYAVILMVSLIGNILIAAVILSNKKMKKPTNYFILNMAISDLVIPTMVISRHIVQLYKQPISNFEWEMEGVLGVALCKIVFFLQDVSTAVSIFSLILITLDRFIAVVYPMKHYVMSNNVCKVSIFMTWFIGMSLHAVYLYIYDVRSYGGTFVCYSYWDKISDDFKAIVRNYYLSMFFILAVVPFVVMAGAYTVIILSLKRQSIPLGDSFSDRQKRQRAERERKILRMAIAIIVSFAILWAPYNIYAFLNFFVYQNPPQPCWFPLFSFIGLYCAYANAAVNPCICFIFSQNFRHGFKQMLSNVGFLKTRMSIRQQNTQVSVTMQNKAYEDDDKRDSA
ncbi:hypothetical protein QZH41_004479 [Actinostola sp. cb2023]|nr:hypothetical protein QZH41_004479 [Actinostola sp. cb2023]